MRIDKGESKASGAKESALNAWQAILLWPLSSGPRGAVMWSVVHFCLSFMYSLLGNLLADDLYLSGFLLRSRLFPCPVSPSLTSFFKKPLPNTVVENYERLLSSLS